MGRSSKNVEAYVCAMDNSAKGSDGNEEYIVGEWRKGKSYYKVSKDLAEQWFHVLWKVELVRK